MRSLLGLWRVRSRLGVCEGAIAIGVSLFAGLESAMRVLGARSP
ncbi:hypothetical protein [Anabaena sp. FACHB-1237]|nr:hypothetical protein [Anabaena sp. FACHB-1237]